jgi:nucleotide-binding universal stress UspA family protein
VSLGRPCVLYAVMTSWVPPSIEDILLVMTADRSGTTTWATGPGEGDTAGRADLAERPLERVGVFPSVLCAAERSANGQAARRYARVLAGPDGAVEFVPSGRLTRHGHRALQDRCEGYDVLVLGAGAGAYSAVEHARIPVLIARRGALGARLIDTILVAVDGSPESSRAVEVAGRLAAAHGAAVRILSAFRRDPALDRAVAATARVLVGMTGTTPRVVGGRPRSGLAIPAAASAVKATLVVVGVGCGAVARAATATTAGSIGCSVLAVPAFS